MGTRFYLAIAAAMAMTAFAIGQAFPGLGVLFLIPASSLWVAWSVRRSKLAGREEA